jgi:hypothetical protein
LPNGRNRVTYQRGATKGKRPKIAKSGYRNTVSQRK